jgi:hypothetical protein
MAISEAYGNTATISTTEYSLPNNSTTLTPITVDGVYQVFIDVSAMASGDEYLIQIKEKCLSAGTQRVVYSATLVGAQAAPIWISPSLLLLHGWDITMDKIAGTDRSISWSIRQVA